MKNESLFVSCLVFSFLGCYDLSLRDRAAGAGAGSPDGAVISEAGFFDANNSVGTQTNPVIGGPGAAGTNAGANGAPGLAANAGANGAPGLAANAGAGGSAGTIEPNQTAGAPSTSAETGGSGGVPATCIPKTETCNNIDDDCDGETDEDVTKSCGLDRGICKKGTLACHAGTWDDEATQCAGAVTAQPNEICDADKLDENCNGVANEGCNCNEGETETCGNPNPPCKQGTLTCTNGKWPTQCVGEVKGTQEVCDGVDNDCTGTIDDDGDNLCSGSDLCAGKLGCVGCKSTSDCTGNTGTVCKVYSCNSSTHRCAITNATGTVSCTTSDGYPGKCCSGGCVKTAKCGDEYLDANEACDIGATSKGNDGLPSGYVYDKFTCDPKCTRRYIYVTCSAQSDCPSDYYCKGRCLPPDTSSTCLNASPGAGETTCRIKEGFAAVCYGGGSNWCFLACSSNDDCPQGSSCTQIGTPPYNVCSM